MRKPSKIGCLLLLMASQISSCSGESLIPNPQFDRWCSDRPCLWDSEGPIRRVGSWHPNDYASQMLDESRLWYVNGTANETNASCLEFSLVSQIASDTRLFLELDFLNDGSVDFSQRLPASAWDKHTFRITAPTWYRGVTFIVRKEAGSTPAIVAEYSAHSASREDCTAPPVELHDLPEGAACSSAADCAEGPCGKGVCGGCASSADCGEDQVCGLYYRNGTPSHVCGARQDSKLGALCDSADQCQSGICLKNSCSECKTNADCDDGAACGPAIFAVSGFTQPTQGWPNQCDPGTQKRASSETCINAVDCSSNLCDDASIECSKIENCGSAFGNGLCLQSCSNPKVTAGTCR
ncbi:MAG: hypothetical protein RL701_6522 [Pseudomonadota bacterium]